MSAERGLSIMYKRFVIDQNDVKNLTSDISAKSLWDKSDYEEWNRSLKDTLKEYIKKSSLEGSLDAEVICNKFFPEENIPIFISHSHADKSIAQKFAIWIKENFDLLSFIDSDLWGNYSTIQSELDEFYSAEMGDRYDLEKKNICSAHVHMMLTYALTRMIDKADFFIFVKSDHSVTMKDSIEKASSSWIFHELETASLISEKRNFVDLQMQSPSPLMEAQDVQIHYPIPLENFYLLTKDGLEQNVSNYKKQKMNDLTWKCFDNYAKEQMWMGGQGFIPSNRDIAMNCFMRNCKIIRK